MEIEINRQEITRNAYGVCGAKEEEIIKARIFLIEHARTPMEVLEAYYLCHNDYNLEQFLFRKLKKVHFNQEDWDFLLNNSMKFGLIRLRDYVRGLCNL